MHEDLLGYLLGALDGNERRRIEKKLAQSAELRQQLRQLRDCLEPLETLAQEQAPPPGLSDRVCRAIDDHEAKRRPTPRSLEDARSASRQRITVSDGVVLALVALAAFTLFFPALANSRFEARIATCQDNMRYIGNQLTQYSDLKPTDRFPFVPVTGNRSFAGIFAPTLLDKHLISSECPELICPGSELAVSAAQWYVPPLDEVDLADGSLLAQLQERAGGSYAYSIGYFEDGKFQAVKNQGRSHFALLTDAYRGDGQFSISHGGRGLNILYEDGHIVFVRKLQTPGDNPFFNRDGNREAGLDPSDSVVLISGMRPIASFSSTVTPCETVRPVSQ